MGLPYPETAHLPASIAGGELSPRSKVEDLQGQGLGGSNMLEENPKP